MDFSLFPFPFPPAPSFLLPYFPDPSPSRPPPPLFPPPPPPPKVHTGEPPFLTTLVHLLAEGGPASPVSDLEPRQTQLFYEAAGLMAEGAASPMEREEALAGLMAGPNDAWDRALAAAAAAGGPGVGLQLDAATAKQLAHLVNVNAAVCQSLGGAFIPQLMRNLEGTLQAYQTCSSLVSTFVVDAQGRAEAEARAAGGGDADAAAARAAAAAAASRTSGVRALRTVKRAVLRLLERFVSLAEDPIHLGAVSRDVLPRLEGPVLGDYRASAPDAREPEVLGLYAALVDRLASVEALRPGVEAYVPRLLAGTPIHPPVGPSSIILPSVHSPSICPSINPSGHPSISIHGSIHPLLLPPSPQEHVFDTTLAMIAGDTSSHPEIRLRFFALLRAVNARCFAALLALSPAQSKLVLDAIVWAVRHTARDVADVGLCLLSDVLSSFAAQPSDVSGAFWAAWYAPLLQETLTVMTDTLHKPGFKNHARILHRLFGLVRTPARTGAPDGVPPPGAGSSPLFGVSLWIPSAEALAADPSLAARFPDNRTYVLSLTSDLLRGAFPNLTEGQVRSTVEGMLDLRDPATFKNHLRDFLVQSRQFADEARGGSLSSPSLSLSLPSLSHFFLPSPPSLSLSFSPARPDSARSTLRPPTDRTTVPCTRRTWRSRGRQRERPWVASGGC